MSPDKKGAMIKRDHPEPSISQQCKPVRPNRSAFYHTPVGIDAGTLTRMKEIDRVFTNYPFFGSRPIGAGKARSSGDIASGDLWPRWARRRFTNGLGRAGPVLNTLSSRICRGRCGSTARTRFGAPTSPMVRLDPDGPGCICPECEGERRKEKTALSSAVRGHEPKRR